MADVKRAFGMAIRLAWTHLGWTQAKREKEAGLAKGHVRHIERGELDPGLSTQERLAAALGIPLAELVADAERERYRRTRRDGAPTR